MEVLCEGSCVYTAWGRKPIEIGRLQRYATDNGAAAVKFDRQPDSGFSVGLVGAGPASLACAARLATLGHTTVIYEKSDFPFEELLMVDGHFVDDLTVKQIGEFLHRHLCCGSRPR